MKIALLILFLIFCPSLLGMGVLKIYSLIANSPKTTLASRLVTAFPTGSMILLGISGASYLIGRFLHLSLSSATKLFAIILIFILTVCYLVMIITRFRSALKNVTLEAKNSAHPEKSSNIELSTTENIEMNASANFEDDIAKKEEIAINKTSKLTFALPLIATCISALVIFLTAQGKVYTSGDITLETVNSFIATGNFYSVNPQTGVAFTNDFPTRMTLESLPFLYAVLAKSFTVKSYILLWNIMPVFWLVNGMCCFWNIGLGIFKSINKKSKADEKSFIANATIFYSICVFLLLCTDSLMGNIGFSALHAGYQSINVAYLLIFGWTLSQVVRKRWIVAILGIVIEPLVVSLQFGVGACFVLVTVMFIISRLPVVKKLGAEEGGSANESAN